VVLTAATVSPVLVIVAAIVTAIVLRDAGSHQSSKAEATS
jgi:hypothetical protein